MTHAPAAQIEPATQSVSAAHGRAQAPARQTYGAQSTPDVAVTHWPDPLQIAPVTVVPVQVLVPHEVPLA
jgi:hypothetical protein